MTMATAGEERIEHFAGQLVQVARDFIDELRTFKQSDQHQVNLLQQLQQLALRVKRIDEDLRALLAVETTTTASDWDREEEEVECGADAWIRYSVHRIAYPILDNLTKCYEILDALPSASSSNGRSSNNKPRPPPGMLSVQNYTDVATLLEVTVCFGIVPLVLDAHVLVPLVERFQAMPRTLLGRMPLKALRQAATSETPTLAAMHRTHELARAAAAVGHLIHLDRFRPMLLPRHLADVYAALLQVEHLTQQHQQSGNNSCRSNAQFQKLQRRLLEYAGERWHCATLRAQAFQRLLVQHGSKQTPVWLRQRITRLLNELATTRLESVVQVFVHTAAAADKTAAALRLAHALTLPSSSRTLKNSTTEQTNHVDGLSKQILQVLDSTRGTKVSGPAAVDEHELITLQFLWMLLDRLPDKALSNTFFQSVTRPFRQPWNDMGEDCGSESIHQAVRRMEKLLTVDPPVGFDQSRFCHLVLWRPIPISGTTTTTAAMDITIVGLWLRLACATSVAKVAVKEDALNALRLALHFMSTAKFSLQSGKAVDGAAVAAACIVYSLMPTTWDLASMKFCFPTALMRDTNLTFNSVTVRAVDPSADVDLGNMADILQKRAEHMFREVVAPMWTSNHDKDDSDGFSSIPAQVLALLLTIFLRSEAQSRSLAARQSWLLMTALVAIPVLCDACPMESLISESPGTSGLLGLMRTVFDFVSKRRKHNLDAEPTPASTDAELVLLRCVGGRGEEGEDGAPPWMNAFLNSSANFGISIAKTMLNILSCMLELGASRRSNQEEDQLRSLMPALEALAQVSPMQTVEADTTEWSEICDAASHICSLIALRSGEPLPPNTSAVETSAADVLRQAKLDLKSTEPPLRARGVASLRQLISSRDLAPQNAARIVVVDDDEPAARDEQLLDVFFLLVGTLADSESYVYLAAIHALAFVIPDVPYLFPAVMTGVAQGSITFNGRSHTLSMQQRVKLTEVVIMVLRRSKKILSQAQLVFGVMLYGRTDGPSEAPEESSGLQEQKQTAAYFEAVDGNGWTNDDWDEKKIRLQTGGPVFANEEPDLVRASLMNLVSETVVLAHPSVSARFCAGLLNCAATSLGLRSTRLVRRAAALLASSLYSATVREMEAVSESAAAGAAAVQCPLTVAMIQGEEENLANLLRLEAAGRKSPASKLDDPATVARCEEALMTREVAENGGILAVGQLLLEQTRVDDPFLVKLLAGKTGG